MTHLDVIKIILDNNPWEIAHRLFTCTECPKQIRCRALISFANTPAKTVCKTCINEWLNEEIKCEV